MKTCRNLLLATLVVLSCLFAFQPAGAVNASALTSADRTCDDIGPRPDRLSEMGFGVTSPHAAVKSALRTAPACVQAGDQDSTTVASNSLECNSIGPLMAGEGTSGFLASTAAPACMVAPDLLQPADAGDTRACTSNSAVVLRSHPCMSPD
jgi:hypothetical protein